METSAFACLGNIFVEPKKALQDIRPHGGWAWYPLVITLILTTAMSAWYFSTVDISWLADQTLAPLASKYSSDQLDAMRGGFTRNRFLFGATVGGTIVILFIYLLQALYFFLVSKLGGFEEQSYGKWFSFTVWTSFPMVLSTIATGIAYLFASHQTSYYALDVTSLNTLLFHLPMSHPLMGVAASVRLTWFWTLALMVLGFALWTRKSLGKSALIVLIPWVLIYVLWIVIKLA
ncbi:MAG: YIP1 family protein [Gammaproteobacteria bacterium]